MTRKPYDDELRGVSFRNDRKDKMTPSRTTQAPCRCTASKYRVGGWVKEAKSGVKYLSLSLRPQDDR